MNRGVRNFCFVLLFVLCVGCDQEQSDVMIEEVCLKESCVQVEIAHTYEQVAKGLMFREHMEAKHGMLFVFADVQQRTFWMKNTLIPLDIVWIDEGKKIVHIERNVPPCDFDPCPRYSTEKAAKYILEVNAGEMSVLNWNEGDVLLF